MIRLPEKCESKERMCPLQESSPVSLLSQFFKVSKNLSLFVQPHRSAWLQVFLGSYDYSVLYRFYIREITPTDPLLVSLFGRNRYLAFSLNFDSLQLLGNF
jgi:hypothetical protein